jgi:hypothetical protein
MSAMTKARRRQRNRSVIGLVVTLAVALAACSSVATPPTTRPSSTRSPASSAASASGSLAASAGSTTSQTDTDWGRIWDTLPNDFPAVAGSTPDDAAAGPASAVLVVQGDTAQSVATSLQTQLHAAGYTTTALGGPLEDGTYTLDMTGSSTGCMLQVVATPTGGLTTVTILYGAACPHD